MSWSATPAWSSTTSGTGWRTGTLGEDINPWGAAMFETLQDVEPSSPVEEAAYGKWLDQTSTREEARQDRIHGAVGVMPMPLWIVLFFIAAIMLVYLFGFADSGERVWVQALFMGSVVAVIAAMLLLLKFLDDPVPRRRRWAPAEWRWNAPCSSSTSSWA